jgi:zinc-ribbon domain
MLVVVVRRAIFVAALLGLVLWPGSAIAQSTPRLAILTIDVWPEFDRPASVLVIYRGQLAPDIALPAQVKVRIPASAGAPSAVALPQPGSESAPVNQWLDLVASKQVTLTRSGDWIEVSFAPISRLFNLEFYDPLNTVTFDRRYTLIWPGDLVADAVAVNVREPLGAASFQSTPALPPGVTDDEGLVAHQWAPGGLAAGQPLTLSLSYRREDKRTSVEALQLATPVPTQPPVPSVVTATESSWLLVVALAVGLALMAGGVLWYARSRRAVAFRPYEPKFRHAQGRRSVRTSGGKRPRPQPRRAVTAPAETSQDAGFCTQCGKPLRSDDVFCSRCGGRVKGR